MPLIVKDPRGMLTQAPERRAHAADLERRRRAAAADDRRRIGRHGGASGATPTSRSDSTSRGILTDPTAPGRPYVLHATDEIVTEFAIAALRRRRAAARPRAAHGEREVRHLLQLAGRRGSRPIASGQERELYDYRTSGGRLELDNSAGRNPMEDSLHAMLQRAYSEELRRPLPLNLHAARERGFNDYFKVAIRVSARATAHRAERELALSRRDAGGAPETTALSNPRASPARRAWMTMHADGASTEPARGCEASART